MPNQPYVSTTLGQIRTTDPPGWYLIANVPLVPHGKLYQPLTDDWVEGELELRGHVRATPTSEQDIPKGCDVFMRPDGCMAVLYWDLRSAR